MNRTHTEAGRPGPTRRERLPAIAELAGYAGVAPFAAGLIGLALLPSPAGRELAQRALVAYGAVILSFVGAVHFGLALAGKMRWTRRGVLGAILPAVAGALATLLGGQRGLALLVAGFGLFWLYEHRVCPAELPEDYLQLRRNLSVAVCALLAIATIASDGAGLP